MMHDQPGTRGEWGEMRAPDQATIATGRFMMPDGIKLFYRAWRIPSAPVLLILHGLGAHSGWFVDMGNALAERGLSVYAVDHRGFGQSDGPRGHIRNYRQLLRDIHVLLERLQQQHPAAPLFILGHSMGGILAIYVAARERRRLAGIILLNPWIRDTSRVPLGILLRVLCGGLLGLSSRYRLAGGPDVMTTNPEAVAMLENDPLWVRAESASFFFQISLMRAGVLRQARRVTIPALVAQAGRDLAVVPAASYRVYERLGSADKTWKVYPDYAHDTELEADRRTLDDDIATWVRQHTR